MKKPQAQNHKGHKALSRIFSIKKYFKSPKQTQNVHLFDSIQRVSEPALTQRTHQKQLSSSQFLSGIGPSFINFIFTNNKQFKSLVNIQKPFGIYGKCEDIPFQLQGIQNMEVLGEGKKIRGIAELAARNLESIIVLSSLTDKLYAIIFNCLQKITIKFPKFQQIISFIRIWQQLIWKRGNEFLLRSIHKFTIKVSFIGQSYWLEVNQPIYNMLECYDWSILEKNIHQDSDQELISYYLRCFYVKQFILMILKKTKKQKLYWQNEESLRNKEIIKQIRQVSDENSEARSKEISQKKNKLFDDLSLKKTRSMGLTANPKASNQSQNTKI